MQNQDYTSRQNAPSGQQPSAQYGAQRPQGSYQGSQYSQGQQAQRPAQGSYQGSQYQGQQPQRPAAQGGYQGSQYQGQQPQRPAAQSSYQGSQYQGQQPQRPAAQSSYQGSQYQGQQPQRPAAQSAAYQAAPQQKPAAQAPAYQTPAAQPPVSPPPAAPVAAHRSTGAPVLQLTTNRRLLKYILLNIVTLGIYGIVLMSSIVDDLNIIASRYDNRKTMSFTLATFFFGSLTLFILPLVWYTQFSARVGDELRRRGIDYSFSGGLFWGWYFFGSLIIVGPFIYMYKLCKAMNKLSADFNVNG